MRSEKFIAIPAALYSVQPANIIVGAREGEIMPLHLKMLKSHFRCLGRPQKAKRSPTLFYLQPTLIPYIIDESYRDGASKAGPERHQSSMDRALNEVPFTRTRRALLCL